MLDFLKNKNSPSKEQLAALALQISKAFEDTGSVRRAVACIKSYSGAMPGINVLIKINSLGCNPEGFIPAELGADEKELFFILSMNAYNYSNPVQSLNMYSEQMDAEAEILKKISTKTGSSNALTTMGMTIFLPLFSGISAGIIGTGSFFVASGGHQANGFLLIMAAYVFAILYLSASFKNCFRSSFRNLLSVIPYFLISVAVMLSTYAYLPYIL